jgi:hypothetical protein
VNIVSEENIARVYDGKAFYDLTYTDILIDRFPSGYCVEDKAEQTTEYGTYFDSVYQDSDNLLQTQISKIGQPYSLFCLTD